MSTLVRGQRGLGIGGHTSPTRGATDDWITPPEVNAALGPFDLDPCASLTQPWPMAERSFTVEQDGLAQPWAGPEVGAIIFPPPETGKVPRWLKGWRVTARNGDTITCGPIRRWWWFLSPSAWRSRGGSTNG
jgi:hypothetical protein